VFGAECPGCIGFEKCSFTRVVYYKKLIGMAVLPQSCSPTVQILICERRCTVEMVHETLMESAFSAQRSSYMENISILADDVYARLRWSVQRFAVLRK
jgi:hypothetical protein